MDQPGFIFIGGRPALDFANTLGGKRGVRTDEHLTGYPQLLRWAAQAKLLGKGDAGRLAREAAQNPSKAQRAVGEAIALREALHGLFEAVAHGREPRAADLDTVNMLAAQAQAQRKLVRSGGRLVLRWDERPGDLLPFLRPLVLEAVGLLASPDAERVRICAECEEDRCDWVFLDESRGGKRRFCSMADCGNRAKQRRFYRRAQEAKAERR